MPVNNVGFRVTGMYFGAKDSITNEIRVDVPQDAPTVYDVMVEVVKKVEAGGVPGVSAFSFRPIFPSSSDSLDSVTVHFKDPPNAKYRAGTYFLQENKMGNPIYVFQYYIFDSNFQQKNNNNQTANFNAPPDAPIQENDTVIWRQVAIMQSPNGANRIEREMAKATSVMKEKGLL